MHPVFQEIFQAHGITQDKGIDEAIRLIGKRPELLTDTQLDRIADALREALYSAEGECNRRYENTDLEDALAESSEYGLDLREADDALQSYSERELARASDIAAEAYGASRLKEQA